MLAPRKTTDLKESERTGLPRRPFIEPLGFSLRLNLWYAAFFVAGAFLLFSLAYILLVREFREIDRDFEPKLIHTLRGAGYSLRLP